MRKMDKIIIFMVALAICLNVFIGIFVFINNYDQNKDTATSEKVEIQKKTIKKEEELELIKEPKIELSIITKDYPSNRGLTIEQILENTNKYEKRRLIVSGLITEELPDYISKRGSVFQQFTISDGTGELLIFTKLSSETKRIEIKQDEKITLRGKIEIHYDKVELTEVELI